MNAVDRSKRSPGSHGVVSEFELPALPRESINLASLREPYVRGMCPRPGTQRRTRFSTNDYFRLHGVVGDGDGPYSETITSSRSVYWSGQQRDTAGNQTYWTRACCTYTARMCALQRYARAGAARVCLCLLQWSRRAFTHCCQVSQVSSCNVVHYEIISTALVISYHATHQRWVFIYLFSSYFGRPNAARRPNNIAVVRDICTTSITVMLLCCVFPIWLLSASYAIPPLPCGPARAVFRRDHVFGVDFRNSKHSRMGDTTVFMFLFTSFPNNTVAIKCVF